MEDFLVMAPEGHAKEAVVRALTSVWEFGKEMTLSPEISLTFLGIDSFMKPNRGTFLTQEHFSQELLTKSNIQECEVLNNITTDNPP